MAARGTKVTVRPIALHHDLEDILDIEESSFEHPWQRGDFQVHLRQKSCSGIVADFERKTVGYVIFYQEAADLFLVNMAVSPNCRRCGVGSRMIGNLLHKAVRSELFALTLLVPRSNNGAVAFCRHNNFKVNRLLRRFYAELIDDAWEMKYQFGK